MKYFALILLFFLVLPAAVQAQTSALLKPPNNLGLVGYWSFNDATSTQAGDFSGNNNSATLSGSVWTEGIRAGAVQHSGGTQYMDVGDPSSGVLDFGASQAFTLTAWVQSGDTSQDQMVLSKRNTAGYQLRYTTGGGFFLRIDEGATNVNLAATHTVMDGKWHHIVAGRSSAGDFIYVDGVLSNSNNDTSLANLSESAFLYMGGHPTEDGGSSAWNGKIDEIRIYNRALGAAEIQALYGNRSGSAGAVQIGSARRLMQGTSLASGLIGYWSFDGGRTNWMSASAGIAYDDSGNSNNGTFTNMERASAPTVGKLGQAMQFDGTNEYMSVAALNHGVGTGDFTWAVWVYPRVATVYGAIMNVGSFAPNLGVRLNSTANWGVYWGGDRASGSTLSLNTWTHVVFQREGSTLRFFENGVQTPTTHTVSTSMANTSFEIGRNGGGGHHCDCIIDDARFYTRALSAAEIQQLYRLGTTNITP